MSYKDFQNELYAIGNKLWLKLQRLPKAEPVEIVSFSVIILFIEFSQNFDKIAYQDSRRLHNSHQKSVWIHKILGWTFLMAVVLLMVIIACSCCCGQCCSGSPKKKSRKIQVRPVVHA